MIASRIEIMAEKKIFLRLFWSRYIDFNCTIVNEL